MTWTPTVGGGGARPSIDIESDLKLRRFLGRDLQIAPEHVKDALTAFGQGRRSYTIREVWLSRKCAVDLGLTGR